MYGMIHKAARDLALEKFGAEAWAAILEKSGLSSEHFVSAQPYDDETTMRLVSAVVERSGLSAEEALEAFGRHWVKFAERSAYASLLDRTGADLPSFLANLDRMHASIKSAMPAASMPSFKVEAATKNKVEVLYQSERSGLAPFVRGILYGLLERFGEKGAVSQKESTDGTRFIIERRAA